MRWKRTAAVLAAAGLIVGVVVAITHSTSDKRPAMSHGSLSVVAAENMWGSIAAQLGGSAVHVTSIVSNPSTDPHDYEPTAADARLLAGAQLVVVNGIGYDPWASKLLAANPVTGRVLLDVGDLLGIPSGGNPHRWYAPSDVQQVIAEITSDYRRLDPKDGATFIQLRRRYESVSLAPYTRELAVIRRRYAGSAVGASESIFAPLAESLGLRLLTPASFLDATSEGTEPTVRDITTIQRQIHTHAIKVWVFNSQNSTPDVQRLTELARQSGIPIVTITETLSPQSATFQSWQVAQLHRLAAALAVAGAH